MPVFAAGLLAAIQLKGILLIDVASYAVAVLTLAVADLCGVRSEPVLDLACAVEMVHACSLVLDDLPSMDDAALRRGRPGAGSA